MSLRLMNSASLRVTLKKFISTRRRILKVNVLGFDYRGYGRSTFANISTTTSETTVDEDLQTIYLWSILTLKIKPHRLMLYGRSLGGCPSTKLASVLTNFSDNNVNVTNDALKALFRRVKTTTTSDKLIGGLISQVSERKARADERSEGGINCYVPRRFAHRQHQRLGFSHSVS